MNNLILKIKNVLVSDIWAILFFGFATILILWQMLLPGYILTLDMIFTPQYRIFVEPGSFINHLPFQWLIFVFSFILPTWLIQKFILFGLFFAMGFLAYKYLPVPKELGANYWAGLFYMANPFVYERLLAGQWMILSSYALLPLVIYLLNNFYNNLNIKNTLLLFSSYLLVGIFSLHLLVISLFIGAIYFIFKINKDNYKQVFQQSLIGFILLIVLSGYWIVPYINQSSKSNLSLFNQTDTQAFTTVGDPVLGITGNVLAMYGFWGEGQPWLSYFIWPKDNYVIWGMFLILLFALIVYGFFKAIKESKQHSLILITLAVAGFIFSVGVSQTIFKSLNQFLFDHLWFWSGFRDTQKWSVLLILVYAIFGAYGVNAIFKKLIAKLGNSDTLKFKLIATVIFFIPVIYTYTIWGGFSRQLKPVWYPSGWGEVKAILDQDQGDYKVLFMPFHQYLSLGFNQQIISQNPAKEFFGSKIIQGDSAEIGEISYQQTNSTSAQVSWVLNNDSFIDQDGVLEALNSLNIKYIIYLTQYENIPDSLDFGFVESNNLQKIFSDKDLTFYRIML